MNLVVHLFTAFSTKARGKRAAFFRGCFELGDTTRVLDLGSQTGSGIHAVLRGTEVQPHNVYIADIDAALLEEGRARYGFTPVLVKESGPLPFPDGYFDVVFCNSVIEHVTLPKNEVWKERSGARFRAEARRRQKEFATEIRRLGRQYFVQTPYRHFPIEPHSWLPFAGWLPRWLLLPVLRLSHRVWVTKTNPDWYLMNRRELAELFAEARIVDEKCWGLTKSIMAVKSAHAAPWQARPPPQGVGNEPPSSAQPA
jgi:SAM-dependent methyltransferase